MTRSGQDSRLNTVMVVLPSQSTSIKTFSIFLVIYVTTTWKSKKITGIPGPTQLETCLSRQFYWEIQSVIKLMEILWTVSWLSGLPPHTPPCSGSRFPWSGRVQADSFVWREFQISKFYNPQSWQYSVLVWDYTFLKLSNKVIHPIINFRRGLCTVI